MEIKITRSADSGKWELTINGGLITAQGTLTALFHKAWKYAKGQDI